jgi:hypothetical protein
MLLILLSIIYTFGIISWSIYSPYNQNCLTCTIKFKTIYNSMVNKKHKKVYNVSNYHRRQLGGEHHGAVRRVYPGI